jgi:hypothetical protein
LLANLESAINPFFELSMSIEICASEDDLRTRYQRTNDDEIPIADVHTERVGDLGVQRLFESLVTCLSSA